MYCNGVESAIGIGGRNRPGVNNIDFDGCYGNGTVGLVHFDSLFGA